MTTAAEMVAAIEANLPTNGAGAITALVLRQTLELMADGQIPTYGFPVGGAAGQIVQKLSATDYDKGWTDQAVVNLANKKYGAVNGTDVSAALGLALDDVIANANGGTVIIPQGVDYYLDSRVVKTFHTKQRITIMGYGEASRLIVRNNVGGISLTNNSAVADSEVTLANLSLEPGVEGAGLGFEVVQAAATTQPGRAASIINVTMIPLNVGANPVAFNKGIRLFGCPRPLIWNFRHQRGQGSVTKMDYVLKTDGCYYPVLLYSYLNADALISWDNKTVVPNGSPEAILAFGNVMSGGDVGYDHLRQNAEPLIYFVGNHINCNATCMIINGAAYGNIEGNLLYVSPSVEPSNVTAIRLILASGLNISNNYFKSPSNNVNHLRNIEMVPVNATDVKNIHVGLNGYHSLTDIPGIYVGPLVDRIEIQLPVYFPDQTHPNKFVEIDAASVGAVTVKRQLPDASTVTTAVGNVGAGEDDLQTYTLPGGFILRPGKGVIITGSGTAANNANAKTLKVYFGATTILTIAITAGSARQWSFRAMVISTGSNTQDYYIFSAIDNTTAIAPTHGTATIDETSDIIIKCTGTATADNDIVEESLVVQFLDC